MQRPSCCCTDEGDRRVWALTIPNIVNNVSTPLLGLVDSIVVGHLPNPDGLAGIALGLAVLNPLLMVFNFLRMGTVGMAAQAYGARDGTAIRALAWRTVILGLACGSIICALRYPISWLMPLLAEDAGIFETARTYFLARVTGAPAALGNYAIQGWLVGVQKSHEALLANFILNAVNAVLCIFLGIWCGFGVMGVGAATAVANYIAMVYGVCRIYALTKDSNSVLGHGNDGALLQVVLDSGELYRLLSVNSAIFFRTACISGMGSVFTVMSGKYGAAVMAANSLLMQLQMLLSLGSDGLASAAEALVGEAIGAHDLQLLRASAWSIGKGTVGLAACFTAVYMLGGPVLIHYFTWHREVQAEAMRYLPSQWISPIVSIWAYILDGFFVGATMPVPMRDSVALSTLFFLLLIQLPLGNAGLWVAYLTHLLVRAIALGAYYPRLEGLCCQDPPLLHGTG